MPIAIWLGERYLQGFVDRVDFVDGDGPPLLVAVVLSVLITAMAATRHVRGALALQPMETLN